MSVCYFHAQGWYTLVFILFPVEVAITAKISQLSMSACGALGEIFRSGSLPLPVGDLSILSEQSKDGDREWEETLKHVLTCSTDELTQLDLVMCLSKLVKSAKEIKACMLQIKIPDRFCMHWVHLYTVSYTECFKWRGFNQECIRKST